MKSIIKIENLKKTYIKNNEVVEIFNQANYNFYTNKLYIIKGKSGSGKTTLINIIGTLLAFDHGKVIIDGMDISTLNENDKTKIRREKIGFIFQSYYLHPYMNAYENVMVPLLLNKNQNNTKEKIINALKKVRLEKRINHFPKELSGGEQQRVAIARSLINNPDIILADEPTGSLDAENEQNILKMLRKIANEGKCVIIVSHSNDIEQYADHILYIKGKKIVEVNNEKKKYIHQKFF